MPHFRVAVGNVTGISQTLVYPCVWPSAKTSVQTLKHNPVKIGEIQLSSPIFPTVKPGFLSVGPWVKEACDTSEKVQLQDIQLFLCLNLEVFYLSCAFRCLSSCQHSQNLADKQKVYNVHQVFSYPIFVFLNYCQLMSYHLCQNLYWYALLQLISSKKWAQKEITGFRKVAQKFLPESSGLYFVLPWFNIHMFCR